MALKAAKTKEKSPSGSLRLMSWEMTLNNRPCHQVRLPNLPPPLIMPLGACAAVVKNLICNGNVLHATAHWHR